MRCFSVLGPSQAGKTTLLKAMSELEGRPVVADFSDVLQLRQFTYLGEPWTGFDIAGGPDNLGCAGGALAASDAAVLCVSPEPDSAVLAAPYLRLIEESGVPCFIFINRMDQDEARISDIVAALQDYANHHIVLRQTPIRAADGHVIGAVDLISERAFEYREGQTSKLIEIPESVVDREQAARADLLEHLADFDDHLMEELIEDKEPPTEEVYAVLAEAHQHNRVMAAYIGAASHLNGVNRLMKALRHETPAADEIPARLGIDTPAAISVASDIKRHVGKSTLLRALGPGVQQRSALGGELLGNLSDLEGKAISGEVEAGGLAIAVKSDHLAPAMAYGAEAGEALPAWTRGRPPAYPRALVAQNERDDARLSSALGRLSAIDPSMDQGQAPGSGHLLVYLQSAMHLRRLLGRLKEDFSIDAEDQSVSGIYRETISRSVDVQYRHKKQTGGAGQFAEVALTVRPLARGEGFAFDETVKGGAVPRNFIPSVAAGAEEAMQQGPLGFPVIDVAVTLTDGKHHSVDSSDHAFRTAGKHAVRDALEMAGPVVLQAIEHVRVHVPSVYAGQLMALAGSLKGQVLGSEAHPDARGWDVFQALIPAAAREELLHALGGLTQGTAWLETTFDHYEELQGREGEKVRQDRAEALA